MKIIQCKKTNFCLLLPLLISSLLCLNHLLMHVRPSAELRYVPEDNQDLKIFSSIIQKDQQKHDQLQKRILSYESRKDNSIVDQNTTLPQEARSVDTMQQERHKRVAEVCASHKGLSVKSKWNYKHDVKHKYILCPIPKSGWSSWKRTWFYINGVIDDFNTDVGVRNDKEAGVQDTRAENVDHLKKQGVFTFVFVRNPWERLVSAYINKAVDYNYSRILHSPCKWEKMVPYNADLTFQQFLTCIVDGSTDMHWTPQHKLCAFCNAKFDFIGHLETVEQDATYVLDILQLNITFPHMFASKKYNTLDVLSRWYKDLPDHLIKKLYRLFEYDFVFHGFAKDPPGRPGIL